MIAVWQRSDWKKIKTRICELIFHVLILFLSFLCLLSHILHLNWTARAQLHLYPYSLLGYCNKLNESLCHAEDHEDTSEPASYLNHTFYFHLWWTQRPDTFLHSTHSTTMHKLSHTLDIIASMWSSGSFWPLSNHIHRSELQPWPRISPQGSCLSKPPQRPYSEPCSASSMRSWSVQSGQ